MIYRRIRARNRWPVRSRACHVQRAFYRWLHQEAVGWLYWAHVNERYGAFQRSRGSFIVRPALGEPIRPR